MGGGVGGEWLEGGGGGGGGGGGRGGEERMEGILIHGRGRQW